jgi:chemotaxis protein CheZ
MNETLDQNAAFQQLGGIVRQLHEALGTLGYDITLRKIASEIPDARDRLAYVGGMTEAAASKVLNLVDAAAPACDDVSRAGQALASTLAAAQAATNTTPAHQAELLGQCSEFTQQVNSFAETQRAVLTDIMLAQDFQDLSGQVIGKIIEIITRTEHQLLDLLVQSSPTTPHIDHSTELAGPQIPEKALQQDDVDDLLASLGF